MEKGGSEKKKNPILAGQIMRLYDSVLRLGRMNIVKEGRKAIKKQTEEARAGKNVVASCWI